MSRIEWNPSGFNAWQRQLDDLQTLASSAKAARLAQQVQRQLIEANAQARLAGVDKDGNALAPLRSKRKGRYRGATGKPLDPFYQSSTVVAGFHTTVEPDPRGWRIRAFVVGTLAKVIGFHGDGRVRGAPRRDVRGVPEQYLAPVRSGFRAWVGSLFGRK